MAISRLGVVTGVIFFMTITLFAAAELQLDLSGIKHKIICETYHEGNWEIFMMNADGSNSVNLTNTTDSNELYPHASPDGTKVCFVADEGEGESKVRNIYYMNIDGTGRTKVADNARQACWKPDGTAIAYLKGEFEKFSYLDFATKGIFIYDLKTGKHTQHPNKDLYHLYNVHWVAGGDWFISTVHGGMGYDHAILAIEANGMGVFDLRIGGCRPEASPDGKKIAWGRTDWELSVGDLHLTLPEPKVTNQHDVITSTKPIKIYHIDWSPDGKYFTFSRGPNKKSLGFAPEMVGIKADGWNICVSDSTGKWIEITSNGNGNKEPDWVPVK